MNDGNSMPTGENKHGRPGIFLRLHRSFFHGLFSIFTSSPQGILSFQIWGMQVTCWYDDLTLYWSVYAVSGCFYAPLIKLLDIGGRGGMRAGYKNRSVRFAGSKNFPSFMQGLWSRLPGKCWHIPPPKKWKAWGRGNCCRNMPDQVQWRTTERKRKTGDLALKANV